MKILITESQYNTVIKRVLDEGRKLLNRDEFINRAQSMPVHQDKNGNPKYDYSEVDYVNSSTKVLIKCKKCGNYLGNNGVSPNTHLSGIGCKKCSYKNQTYTKDEFIRKAQSMPVHQDKNGNPKYDYSEVDYVNSLTKVLIKCKKCGDYLGNGGIIPSLHLRGNGCKKCSYKNKTFTKDEFIRKAQSMPVHQDEDGNPKYDYSEVDYVNSLTKVLIKCKKCGNYLGNNGVSPNTHLSGKGCKKCVDKNITFTKDEFINRAQSMTVHQDENGNPKYDYSEVDYVNSYTPVLIKCKKCGDYLGNGGISPGTHLSGTGCRKCFYKNKTYTKDKFINRAQSMTVHQDENGNPKYDYSEVDYVDYYTPVLIKCKKCGNYLGKDNMGISPNIHIRGVGCNQCLFRSKGEYIITNVIKELGYFGVKRSYESGLISCIGMTKKLKKLKNKLCYNLKYDFLIPKQNSPKPGAPELKEDIYVEYDGSQHFEFREFIYGSIEDFYRRINDDRRKNDECKDKNWKLIRIGYKDRENLTNELIKGIKSEDRIYLSTNYPRGKGWDDKSIKDWDY